MARRKAASASTPQLLLGAGALIAIAALAVASAWDIYGTARVAVVAAVGLLIGIGSVTLGLVLGWRWWGIALAALGGYLLAVVPTAIPASATSVPAAVDGVLTGLASLITGWKQLLTITLPAADYQGVLVPFFVTMLVSSLAAFALIAFGKRFAPFAVIPMVAMVIFGAAFGNSARSASTELGPWVVGDSHRVAIATLTVAVCVGWLIGHARLERTRAVRAARKRTGVAHLGSSSFGYTARRFTLGLAVVTVAVLAAVVAAPVATSFGDREVPRDVVDPMVLVRAQPSPLTDYRAWFAGSAYSAALFEVAGAQTSDRLRIATLADYDGETFRVAEDARFVRQPRTQDHAITVTIRDGYQGIWVPVASALSGSPTFAGPRAEELADSYYADTNDNLGVIVTSPDENSPGLREGDSYSISAETSVGPEALANARGDAARISPEAHPQLAAWVKYQQLGRSGADLTELITRLKERGYLSHATRESTETAAWVTDLKARSGYELEGSRPGHSAARVDELFAEMLDHEMRALGTDDPAQLVSAVGDDEQFAVAAALLANYLGFEARVVQGVRLGTTGQDLGVQPCEQVCTGANVTVWTEVLAPSGDWVTYDVTPQFTTTPMLIRQGQTLPENPTEPDQIDSEVVPPPSLDNETAAEQDPVEPTEATWIDTYLTLIVSIVVIAFCVLALLLPLVVFPLAKAFRRRWRRRNAVPEVAMVGAWQDLVDTYVDLGVDVPYALTRAETADVLGRQSATTIAAVVDRAVFAEHPPTRDASDATWEIYDDERRTLGSEFGWWRRLRARFTPASLMRAARKDVRVARSGIVTRER